MIGTYLERIILRETGEEPCAACQQDILDLDQMTVEQVLAAKEALAKVIVERARGMNLGWIAWMATEFAPSVVELRLCKWIEEACNVR